MAPLRNKATGGPRSDSIPAHHSDIPHQPTITVDSGTPIKASHHQDRSSQDSTSSHGSARLRGQSRSVFAQSWSSPASRPILSAGPRSSIDDDNGEGDLDLTSLGDSPDDPVLSESEFSDDIDGENEDEETPNGVSGSSGRGVQASPLQRSSSTPVLISAPPNAFAPPFYNRPPTPLPPSPSLTSLLRPTFSSRPTTPDDSESEAAVHAVVGQGSATEAAVAKSARDARTIPRASPKVPTYEYYGFVLYLTSGLCFLMYLLWSYLPSPFLHQLGIYYYPDRWWSLAVPAFLIMLILYIYVALAAYNVEYLTPRLGSMTNIVDEAANVAAIKAHLSGAPQSRGGRSVKNSKGSRSQLLDRHTTSTSDIQSSLPDWERIWDEGTDAVMDVPIGGVCEILYSEK